MNKKYIFNTKYGWILVKYTNKGIVSLRLPSLRKNIEYFCKEKVPTGFLKRLKKDFNKYFDGKKVSFKYPVVISEYTEFSKKVWLALIKIPYGKVVSYKKLAEKIRNLKSFRAVGNALTKNPIPVIIPCHRVILSNGELGRFSGGIKWKKLLLKIEGVLKYD
ncbi:MAG: methylated-DNA--[protein]-cysteine S-methyltransferase [Candidatus Firestonebacteria bacterium]